MSDTGIQKRKKKTTKRSCIFCRRSHVNCDDKRPCTRCIKRNIAHLCSDSAPANGSMDSVTGDFLPSSNITNLLGPQSFVSQNMGSEFSSLNEFLSMLDEPLQLPSEPLIPNNNNLLRDQQQYEPVLQQQQQQQQEVQTNPYNIAESNRSPPLISTSNNNTTASLETIVSPNQYSRDSSSGSQNYDSSSNKSIMSTTGPSYQSPQSNNLQPLHVPSLRTSVMRPTAKEQFFLTAADPNTEITPEEKLKSVINAKLQAGLLKPYNYAAGYTRLQEYMNEHMSAESQQRILEPLNSIRPAFRSIAKSLKDIDLVLVEEGFERMLLGYDRVFTSMSMPACLWRRTGEIYRANKEFATLVGVTVDDLRDGKLAIYELMGEQSAVNFWEKYGSIAFDKGQKAVLTSCTLITRDQNKIGKKHECCFSFTIRRDRYNIPICIVGNFIPISKD